MAIVEKLSIWMTLTALNSEKRLFVSAQRKDVVGKKSNPAIIIPYHDLVSRLPMPVALMIDCIGDFLL